MMLLVVGGLVCFVWEFFDGVFVCLFCFVCGKRGRIGGLSGLGLMSQGLDQLCPHSIAWFSN
jgi:hypothetical protein